MRGLIRCLLPGALVMIALVACGGDSITTVPLSSPTPRPTARAVLSPSPTVESFAAAVAGEWTRIPPPPELGRQFLPLALDDGRALVFDYGLEGTLRLVHVYDPDGSTWGELPIPESPRRTTEESFAGLADAFPLLLSNGNVLLTGDSYHLLDLAVGAWSQIPSPESDGQADQTVSLPDGRALRFFVYSRPAEPPEEVSAAILEPDSGEWTIIAKAPIKSFGRFVAVALDDGRVMLVRNQVMSKQAIIFDPESGDWSETAPPALRHRFFGVAKLGDGRVVMAGGDDGSLETIALAEVYDPQSDTWTQIADMTQAGFAVGIGSLADGRPMLVSFSTATLGSVGLNAYDPVSDSWEEIPLPPFQGTVDRTEFRAAMLTNGTILMLEGPDDFVGIAPGAWIYLPLPR